VADYIIALDCESNGLHGQIFAVEAQITPTERNTAHA